MLIRLVDRHQCFRATCYLHPLLSRWGSRFLRSVGASVPNTWCHTPENCNPNCNSYEKPKKKVHLSIWLFHSHYHLMDLIAVFSLIYAIIMSLNTGKYEVGVCVLDCWHLGCVFTPDHWGRSRHLLIIWYCAWTWDGVGALAKYIQLNKSVHWQYFCNICVMGGKSHQEFCKRHPVFIVPCKKQCTKHCKICVHQVQWWTKGDPKLVRFSNKVSFTLSRDVNNQIKRYWCYKNSKGVIDFFVWPWILHGFQA